MTAAAIAVAQINNVERDDPACFDCCDITNLLGGS